MLSSNDKTYNPLLFIDNLFIVLPKTALSGGFLVY